MKTAIIIFIGIAILVDISCIIVGKRADDKMEKISKRHEIK